MISISTREVKAGVVGCGLVAASYRDAWRLSPMGRTACLRPGRADRKPRKRGSVGPPRSEGGAHLFPAAKPAPTGFMAHPLSRRPGTG